MMLSGEIKVKNNDGDKEKTTLKISPKTPNDSTASRGLTIVVCIIYEHSEYT